MRDEAAHNVHAAGARSVARRAIAGENAVGDGAAHDEEAYAAAFVACIDLH